MKNSIFIFLLAIIICGCDTFNELAKEAKEVAVKSEKVFQGNRRKLMLGIQARYKAEAINVGVSRRTFGNESNEWVSVLVHNGVELSESEEIILAKAVYRQMDTSLVEGDIIEIVQSSQTGKTIRFSSSHSNRYAYHQIDPNVPEPKPIGEETINVVGVLDSLITLNENQCNTKFYKGLLNSWNGNIDQANKDFLAFEKCDIDRNQLGRYSEATNYIVLLINQNTTEEIKEGVEFLIPGLDSLQYDEYSLFGEW